MKTEINHWECNNYEPATVVNLPFCKMNNRYAHSFSCNVCHHLRNLNEAEDLKFLVRPNPDGVVDVKKWPETFLLTRDEFLRFRHLSTLGGTTKQKFRLYIVDAFSTENQTDSLSLKDWIVRNGIIAYGSPTFDKYLNAE